MPSNLKRYQTDGSYHFITFSCYRRKPFLNSDRARIVFEETLERLRQRHDFYIFGYVLMPEHVHLANRPPLSVIPQRSGGTCSCLESPAPRKKHPTTKRYL